MLSTEDSIFMIITTGEFIIGLLGNGLIGLVTCIDWIKKKKLSSVDCILTSLAISRFCLICVIVLNIILKLVYPDFYFNKRVRIVNDTFWVLSHYTSTWFGTFLSVFYFLKIGNFSHPLFLWLKWRIDRAVVRIVLGCLAISLLTSFTLAMIVSCGYLSPVIAERKSNFSKLFYVSNMGQFDVLTVFNLLGIIPLTASLILFFLLIISLWRHTKQMKDNHTARGDSSTGAHVTAIKTVISFIFLLLVYYLASFWLIFNYYMKEKKLAVISAEIIEILYPAGHSLILILAYTKLRQASARMLTCGKRSCMI